MGTDKLPELQPEMKGSQQTVVEALPPGVTNISRNELSQFVHTKRVGPYLLGRTLGEGAFAKVKEALHITTGEKVAVKVIDKKKAKDDAYVHRNLRREAKLLQMLRQRNIIQLLEVVETDNSYYLVTELCKGGELMDHICKQQHLDEDEVRKYVRQIVLAVHHFHMAGIVHRDLKVENLLLDENMDVKIIGKKDNGVRCPPTLFSSYSQTNICSQIQTQRGLHARGLSTD
jgi:Neu-associated kinase